MKRLVLGDIHGHWETLISVYDKEDPDEVIILGDYFDSFGVSDEAMLQCFENLIHLHDEHLKKGKGDFILLYGNHDFHYFDNNEQYSGYRARLAYKIRVLLEENVDKFKYVYIDENNNTIYSHAGITNTWIQTSFGKVYDENSYKHINELNQKFFKFTFYGGGDYYGNSIYQGPLWVRPRSLNQDSLINSKGEPYVQIVGHTNHPFPIVYDKTGREMDGSDIDFINEYMNEVKLLVIDTMPDYYVVEQLDENKKVISRKVIENT